MYTESITLIDEGDIIAFIDDLGFDFEGVHEITADEALTIDWVKVHKAQITGARYELTVTHEHTGYHTTYGGPITENVLVYED